MMTRSIVGRFLILAVLLVSLGVIAQAALIITRGPGKAVAKANAAPLAAPAAAVASAAPAPVATPPADAPAQQSAQPADAAPIRVVYPGPLGDTPVQPRKFAGAAPAVTAALQPAAPAPAVQAPAPAVVAPAAAAPAVAVPAVAAAPAPTKPSPVVVASADADTQPAVEPATAPAGKGGVNLNSASIDALNHLGGGHIGQTIVKHRPYGSVEDLVRKRVVRRSVYEQIKNQVAAQ